MALTIRRMTQDDIALGMRLKRAAGWNQLEADWQRFLTMEPDGCFVAELDGQGVGTTATAIFGPAACVALVLVDERLRGRGVGTALMRQALDYLDGHGVASIRLDATTLGRPIYEKLGFVAEYELARFEGVLPSRPVIAGIEPAQADDLEGIIALDRELSGIDRRKMLTCFFREHPAALRVGRVAGVIQGYLTSRPGTRATQIGPCLSRTAVGATLLSDAWSRLAGQTVFLDVPLDNQPAAALAESMGLTVQRRLLRMCRGEPIRDRVADIWASSGPEKG